MILCAKGHTHVWFYPWCIYLLVLEMTNRDG